MLLRLSIVRRQCEALIADIEAEIKIHATNFEKLNELYNQKIQHEGQLDRLLDEWVTLSG